MLNVCYSYRLDNNITFNTKNLYALR